MQLGVKDQESLPYLRCEVYCAHIKSLVEITRVSLTVPFTLFWSTHLSIAEWWNTPGNFTTVFQ